MDSTNVAMFSTQYLVAVASSVVAITAFGFGDEALNGPLAYAGNSLSYCSVHSEFGCANHHATNIV